MAAMMIQVMKTGLEGPEVFSEEGANQKQFGPAALTCHCLSAARRREFLQSPTHLSEKRCGVRESCFQDRFGTDTHAKRLPIDADMCDLRQADAGSIQAGGDGTQGKTPFVLHAREALLFNSRDKHTVFHEGCVALAHGG